MLDLGQIRNEIDGIDKQLVELFEQRMKLTKEVAEYKIQTGKKVLDREREKAKIESVTKLVKNKENVHAIDDLFSQIMANSRKGQYQLLEAMGQTLRQPYEAIDEIKKDGVKIVYQGIPGAYTCLLYTAMESIVSRYQLIMEQHIQRLILQQRIHTHIHLKRQEATDSE